MKPTYLEFQVKNDQLYGLDSINAIEYEVRWCGNGAYSHYVLTDVNNSEVGWYVYVNEKDALYRAIYDAEMRMIYKAILCQVCKTSWIGNGYKVCYSCVKREREAYKKKRLIAELEEKLWETLP